ncbi:MAG: rhomboid family intramembrane serine protease [Herpetosiphonaceae bacterium]|nr:MAG: rhomboid family intramembrane serine protease [Herpetosiphonaceae bacterium]
MIPICDTVRSRTFPLVNWLLIGANIFFFFVELSLGRQTERFIYFFGLVPARFFAESSLHEVLTLFSSMFLHGGWAHLFSNMLALYIFGDNVEDSMGHLGYLGFYLLCGLAAGATHLLFNPTSPLPSIGASGAISGVLGAYLVLFPFAEIITLIPIFFIPWFIQIPAIFYLGIWFLSQLFNGTLAIVSEVQALGGIAWWAHAGGFIAGIFLAPFYTRRRYRRRSYADEYWPW